MPQVVILILGETGGTIHVSIQKSPLGGQSTYTVYEYIVREKLSIPVVEIVESDAQIQHYPIFTVVRNMYIEKQF